MHELEPAYPAHMYWWRTRQILLWLNRRNTYSHQDGDRVVERFTLPESAVELETCDCDDCAMGAA